MTEGSSGALSGPSDLNVIEEIDVAECWRLMAAQAVGRVAIMDGHYPVVLPVNFATDGRSIVFQTGAGTKLWAIQRVNVTFEVDSFDVSQKSGWSVLVKGSAHEVSRANNPNLVRRAAAAGAVPWAPGAHSHVVRMVADEVTGRRIRLGDLPAKADLPGYV
jgi:nitroimidazol reductase NimA-like FMN-containing flavoprotein (pyridoxamine 5'-phosphate oxidase superfamily)